MSTSPLHEPVNIWPYKERGTLVVIQPRALRWVDHPALFRYGQGIHRSPQSRRGHWSDEMWGGLNSLLLLALKTQEGAMSQGMWAASGSWKRQGKRLSSRAFRKAYRPPDILILAWWDPCWMSNLQNCIANVWFFLNLFNWRLITLQYCSDFCHTMCVKPLICGNPLWQQCMHACLVTSVVSNSLQLRGL